MHFGKMRLRVFSLVVLVAAAFVVLAVTAVFARTLRLTPPDGLSATPIASGNLLKPVHAVLSDALTDEPDEEEGESEMSHSATEIDVSTITVTKFTVEPGGTFGWHQHGGPVWVIIVTGTLTIYSEMCEQQVHTTGSAFLDYGNHTHIGINEDSEPLELYAVFMLPEGGAPRIDAEQPEGCANQP
jgi:quercetin dioxygenase-like cupin family protein